MKGWLVNDCLTCIPGTETLWHSLLKSIPNLEDRTNVYTNYSHLAQQIERQYSQEQNKPAYIIRNASFFPKMKLGTCRTISLLQDVLEGSLRANQLDVCNNSDVVVVNSPYTKWKYESLITSRIELIPLGINFELFKPDRSYCEELGILENSILFVGSSQNVPKGFDKVLDLINNTQYNFCLVLKDDFRISHPRVRVFNKVSHELLTKIINSCSLLICTSQVETQHLAGIEAAACDLPIVTTNVGVYFDKKSGDWGLKIEKDDFKEKIDFALNNRSCFSPRKFFMDNGYEEVRCMKKWNELIEDITK